MTWKRSCVKPKPRRCASAPPPATGLLRRGEKPADIPASFSKRQTSASGRCEVAHKCAPFFELGQNRDWPQFASRTPADEMIERREPAQRRFPCEVSPL